MKITRDDDRQLLRRGLAVLNPVFKDISFKLTVQNPKDNKQISAFTEGFETDADVLDSIEDPWFIVVYIANGEITSVKRQASYFRVDEDKLVLLSIMNREIAAYNKWVDIIEIPNEQTCSSNLAIV